VTPSREQMIDEFLRSLAHLAVDELLANPDGIKENADVSGQEDVGANRINKRTINRADSTTLLAST
jgi:hypothetical protein